MMKTLWKYTNEYDLLTWYYIEEASETEILKMLTFFNTFFPETRLYIGLKKFLLSLRKVH